MTHNQITAPAGVEINLQNDNKVEEYVKALLKDTRSGVLQWKKSRMYVTGYEFFYEGYIVQLAYTSRGGDEMDSIQLRLNRIGNLKDLGSLIMGVQAAREKLLTPEEEDPLSLLWMAAEEQASRKRQETLFDHIDTYLSRSKQSNTADELVAVVEWACEELLDAIKEYRETQ